MSDVADFNLQRKPHGTGQPIQEMVREDLHQRELFGVTKYGEALLANNGRDCLLDAYEEALDLVCYLKQRIIEEAANPFVGQSKWRHNVLSRNCTLNVITSEGAAIFTLDTTGTVHTESYESFKRNFTEIMKDE